ncbi:DNA helicase-2/ATP-dependent DNA helicase PcrA [Clostridium pascui]|nr:DNA helicase-2/ATP-dependent DNA helicase PcrA [Clostridium pascui]
MKVSKMSSCNLDKWQFDAVKSKKRNLLIVAPPGSGKTTVIINRIEYLIKSEGVKGENIIVITFTKAAAKNMYLRYVSNNNLEVPAFFGTFHSLFYRILYKNSNKPQIITGDRCLKIIDYTLRKYTQTINEEKLKGIINSIYLYKSSGKNLDEFRYAGDKEVFYDCYNEYEKYKKEKGLIDFEDLQIMCENLLRQDRVLCNYYKNKFKHILIDEFQDCDNIQLSILKMLNKDNSIFAVGDEDQCIYGFRGSNPGCMVYFDKYFQNGEKVYLHKNYRSALNVVDFSRTFIKNNKLRNEKIIEAFREDIGDINVLTCRDEREESIKVAQDIKDFIKDKKIEYKNIAVLYRTNNESLSLIDVFLKQDIPFKLLDKNYNIFNHFLCKDIISYLKLAINPYDRESFINIINRPLRYISKVDIHNLNKNPLRESCFEILAGYKLPIFKLKIIRDLQKKINKMKNMSPIDAIEYVVHSLNYEDYIESYIKKTKKDKEELKDFIEMLKSSSEDFMNIEEFINYIERGRDELPKESSNAVTLSSIHGVKGMEFECVLIVNCIEGNIPHKNGSGENLEEERRIFYVGVTRAKKYLTLCIPKVYKGQYCNPSKFIGECGLENSICNNPVYKDGENVKHIYLGEGIIDKVDENFISILFKNNIKRQISIKNVVENKILSLIKHKNV